MKKLFLPVSLILLFSQIQSWGANTSDRPRNRLAESYPSLYRGDISGDTPLLFAHLQRTLLDLEPAYQFSFFIDTKKAFEASSPLDEMLHPDKVGKERLEKLYTITTDRVGQIYYLINGYKLYPFRAIDFHFVQEAGDCGQTLRIEIETEWVTPSPDYGRTERPPLLDLNRNPDGPLIFSGRKFVPAPLYEFKETKFHLIRFPQDLPEALKERFKKDIDLLDHRRSSSSQFYAPQTGFLPLELTYRSDQLPRGIALAFFYEKKGIWKEIRFPFELQDFHPSLIRTISQFDLNRNGRKEYLVEASEAGLIRRMIYEVNDETAEATLMTSTIPDELFIPETEDPSCSE